MSKTAPIKRDKSLVLLSRDHHDGLMLVWKTRQGIRLNVDTDRISNYIVNRFDAELEAHFTEEETLLFVRLQSTNELRIKAEDQHAAIRKMIAAFRSSSKTEVSDLMSFAALLEEHIRFEERTLFPALEQTISRSELDQIGQQLEEDKAAKVCVDWEDEFWIKK